MTDDFEKRIKELVHFHESGRIWIDRNAVLDEYRTFKAKQAKGEAGLDGLREFVTRLVARAEYLKEERVNIPVRLLRKSLEMYPASPPPAEAKADEGLRQYLKREIHLLKTQSIEGPFQDGMKYAYENILSRRPIAEENTAPVGLVAELRAVVEALRGAAEFTKNDGPFQSIEAQGHQVGCLECYTEIGKELSEMLSRYEGQKEVVLGAEDIKAIEVLEPCVEYPDREIAYFGKRGRLVFIEDKEGGV